MDDFFLDFLFFITLAPEDVSADFLRTEAVDFATEEEDSLDFLPDPFLARGAFEVRLLEMDFNAVFGVLETDFDVERAEGVFTSTSPTAAVFAATLTA